MKSRANLLVAAFAGFIFALGLGISGMTQPSKVIGYLNVLGAWDPSLLFVMASALAVSGLTNFVVRYRPKPFLAKEWHLPKKTDITPRLIIGSILFGIGWGLVGFCPAPALVSVVSLNQRSLLFVMSMVAGMLMFSFYDRRKMS